MEENTENYQEISGEEFEAILRGEREEYLEDEPQVISEDRKCVVIKGLKVYERVMIDTENLPYNIIIKSGYFQEINFVYFKSLENYDTKENLHFAIERLITYKGDFEYTKSVDLFIEGGIFNIFNIYSGQFRQIGVRDAVFDMFSIYEGEFSMFIIQDTKINYFKILEGVFDIFTIQRALIENQLFIDENPKFNTFSILEGEYNSLEILRGEFVKFQIGINDTDINNDTLVLQSILFRGGNFSEVLIAQGTIKKGIYLGRDLQVKKDFRVTNGLISIIEIESCTFDLLNFIFSKNLEINIIRFISPKIKNIILRGLGSHIYIDDKLCPINSIQFRHCDLIAGSMIKIVDLPINNISFYNAINLGSIIFSSVKGKYIQTGNPRVEINPLFKIHNSDLGKTTFIDCDFEEMKLDFKSSKITEVFLAGTKMPKEITTTDNDINVANEQKRLGYGQLKKIYDNRGDTVTANEYFAKEMNVFLKKKGIGVGEKINVGLNWLSSNHGTNWLQALGSTLLVAVFFFCLYGMSIGIYPTYKWNKQTSEVFYKYAGYFVEFINPFHKADYIPQDLYNNEKLKISGWTRSIDGISRIFIAYFVYQLIQAFRKHRRGS